MTNPAQAKKTVEEIYMSVPKAKGAYGDHIAGLEAVAAHAKAEALRESVAGKNAKALLESILYVFDGNHFHAQIVEALRLLSSELGEGKS